MKIEKISKQKNGKYKILFDDGESLTTFDEVILKHQLLFGHEITPNLYHEIETETSYYEVFNQVVSYIEHRLRSKKEIREYLEKKAIDEVDTERIMKTLEEKGFIDDDRFLEAYISDKLYLSKVGPLKIMKDLLSHDISEEKIRSVLDGIPNEVLYDRLYKQMEKRIKSNHKYARGILKQKLVSYFMEQGYTKELITSIFDELYKEDPSILEREANKIREKLKKKYSGQELEYHLVSKLYQKGFLKEEIDQIKEESY